MWIKKCVQALVFANAFEITKQLFPFFKPKIQSSYVIADNAITGVHFCTKILQPP